MFTIRLPLAVDNNSAKIRKQRVDNYWSDERTPRMAEPHSLENVQVLLVDDDLDNLQLLAMMLSGQRARVPTASTAAEALQLLDGVSLTFLCLIWRCRAKMVIRSLVN